MPPLSDDRLAALLAEVYGEATCTLDPLDGEFDQNVSVRCGVARSVLKVVASTGEAELVELQVDALSHLAERAPDLPVPRVLPTVGGRLWVDVEVEGRSYRVWRISWLEGDALLDAATRSPRLLGGFGRLLGRLAAGLAGFDHPLLTRPHRWDPARGGWVFDHLDVVSDEDRGLLERVAARWPALERRLAPLPVAVVHGDANDHNVLVDQLPDPTAVTGIFDFGDMVTTTRVCEAAVAAAYAGFRSPDPIGAMAALVAGFDEVAALSDDELDVVGDLVRVRLSISVVTSARRARDRPGEPYLSISEQQAWSTLRALDRSPPGLITARIREACGRPPFRTAAEVEAWVLARRRDGALAPILPEGLRGSRSMLLDLSVGSELLGADPADLETGPLGSRIDEAMARARARVGIGRWNEARPIYLGPAFADGDHPIDDHRTIHLGVDFFVDASTSVHTPLDAVVEAVGDNRGYKDYGPVVLLRHEPVGAPVFWTLWGHLDAEVLSRLEVGDELAAGEVVARVGAPPRNGDWPAHLHLQMVLDPLGLGHDVPGVAPPRERSTWKAWFPDPSALCGLEPGAMAAPEVSDDDLVRRRSTRLGTGLSLSYRRPLHIVRGWRQYLYDAAGRTYLDLYNNVPHVGHSHPKVAEAVARQVALLNTNTRYLHETILEYADALVARLPAPLEVVWVLNSASEANELALRLARAHTGRREVVVQSAGYHGHTTTLIDVSSYKFEGPGGEGRPPWVEVVDVPDVYRGVHRMRGPAAGLAYGSEVADRVETMVREGRPPGAFLAETCPSVGGQIMPPPGYLAAVYEAVRAAGGVCIADEVQTGFGRLGRAYWGFELQEVVPDIVVLGKPAANGMPLGVVVATRDVSASFDTGMEFFSTFGGNPVAVAAASAVLEIVEEEGLQERARIVGDRLLSGLEELAGRTRWIGDVRGSGLFVGVEFVADREARTPAPEVAAFVAERLREKRILTGTDGPDHNVLKLRGPLVLDAHDIDRFLTAMAEILAEADLLR